MQSTGLMDAYRGNQSRLPVLIQKPDTTAEENGSQSSDSGGGGSIGAGGGDDFVLADLQARVGAAEDALKRAQASGVGVATAKARLAAAKRLLAEHGFGAAAVQVCAKKRSKTGGKSRRPKTMPRARSRREKGKT